jgi:catechol 2,3-dioxygenase-like lactoylglutathione lyase family enzyme
MSATATATAVQLRLSLHVTDLGRATRFYRALLAVEPTMQGSQQVRFELTDPPLLLSLVPGAHAVGGSINHIGFRAPDSATLVEMQRRLEEAGIPTQRQEGIECCYARQTKFWVTDPDRNLWELYVLEEDVDHSGFEDAPRPAAPAASVIWEHRLMEPIPQRLPHADGSVDEVRLEGTFNARRPAAEMSALLAEARRVLRPGGKIVAHGLVGARPIEAPQLPGLAALVQRVPTAAEAVDALQSAGFTGLFFEKLGDVTCLKVDGVDLHEMRLLGWRSAQTSTASDRRVLYKGPLAQVTGDDRTVYPRGVTKRVSQQTWEQLQQGPGADQFVFFPE